MSPHALGIHLEALQVNLEHSWVRSLAPRFSVSVMPDSYWMAMRQAERHIVKEVKRAKAAKRST